MNSIKRKRLEKSGWKVGNASKFLNLTPEEADFVALKLALSKQLQQARKEKNMTQLQLAKLLNSSQSRIAKMEAGDPTVSLDLLVRSLLALGATRKSLGKMVATG